MAILLAADTALGACSVAILDGDQVLARHWEAMERGHAEALAPMVEAAIAEAGLSFSQIGRLAVTTGPGTFTGQRVGLAFMRGLRVALGKPLTGVTTLAAMAAAAKAECATVAAAAIHDARRDEVYLEILAPGTVAEPVLLTFTEAIARLAEIPQGIALAGTARESAGAALAAGGSRAAVSSIATPDALWVARLALALPERDTPPQPLYLRPPDAKLPESRP